MNYVVYGCEHLRDGQEEWAKVFNTIEAAMKCVNDNTRFAQSNHTFRLFELGNEIQIKQKTIKEEEKVVVKSHTIYEIG